MSGQAKHPSEMTEADRDEAAQTEAFERAFANPMTSSPDIEALIERVADAIDNTAIPYGVILHRRVRKIISRAALEASGITDLREALERIAATVEVVGSETDDSEVGTRTELSEWEMVNIARQALQGIKDRGGSNGE
jgi:prophage DNA circulation protein